MSLVRTSPELDVKRQDKAVLDASNQEHQTSQVEIADDMENKAIQMACRTHLHQAFNNTQHTLQLLAAETFRLSMLHQ